ncbi:flagellar hook protein [Candidatus Propionivibrio aalborgensis]|uniref:Flagellar hook protein FlgE n=1 Tax=Candidatus Propionivibrio aalborgensis TaxID=1860101 RepID=A0A1A8XVV2_9RHOO|nr:flagellar hook protein FlgE [Candidatus Propionivibrio aalborgensis]MBK9029468.1 flagellar hook protein FlgE [Propionivibrio sp.]SBT08118.1 flagellar hook protein [Candidatus Propionivibrio aalborgensis]
MSFQQGLSGLNSSSKALDVLGNNIANANTVGFKSAEVHFADVFANSLAGSGASQVGIGSAISGIQQAFSQGNVTATNNPLDISINGGGFFRMDRNGEITYTRNGQFHLDNAGYIVNDQAMRLMGFPADANGLITASSPVDLQLSASQISPRATSDPLAGTLTANLNLDSREGVPAVTPFNFANPQTYNYSTALSVYDTLGVAHTLTMYFQRASAGGPWNVYGTMDGATPQAFPSQLAFNTSGVLTTAMPLVLPSWALTTGAASPWSPGSMDFTGTSQYGSASSVDRLTQGGYTTGSLTGLSVGSDGVVQGRYSNGQARNLGQVVLATFTNPNGLQSLGNNQWALTSVSGPELVSAPGTGSRGVLQSASVEESNVDLTAQLVNMITQQRNYQANAQTIKTQDQILQTLVNLR